MHKFYSPGCCRSGKLNSAKNLGNNLLVFNVGQIVVLSSTLLRKLTITSKKFPYKIAQTDAAEGKYQFCQKSRKYFQSSHSESNTKFVENFITQVKTHDQETHK